jgi:ketosteroid isomerase-like protein
MLLLAGPLLAKDNEAEIKTAVENRYKELLAAVNKKDAAALTEFYDEDAVLMPQMEEPLLGKAAIGEYYKKLVVNPLFSPFMLTPNWSSFHAAGDFAIVTWRFEGVLAKNGGEMHFRGKYLLIWKKQANGSWKIFRYMYDEIPPKR